MESFFRYISYVDYYKKGERTGNVGFLRWKLNNNKHHVEIQLKDVFSAQGSFEIQEKNTGKVIGEIKIDRGIGNFTKKFPVMAASGEMYIDTINDRLYLCDIEGFQIKLNVNEYLLVPVRLEQEKKFQGFSETVKKDKEDTVLAVPEKRKDEVRISIDEKYLEESREEVYYKKNNIVEKISISEEDNLKEDNLLMEKNELKKQIMTHKEYREEDKKLICEKCNKKERILSDETEKSKLSQEIEAASENVLIEGIEEKYVDSTASKKIKIIEPIHEDKWQQLCTKYPKVHPFPNKKIFLSIRPEDFIVLQQGYQKLVHNSFLLHGFYNYGHMILGKLADDEKAPVYIGVPGVYYEREKQAAQMFGFVGFESTEHPVQAGSYGYYMIEVEL